MSIQSYETAQGPDKSCISLPCSDCSGLPAQFRRILAKAVKKEQQTLQKQNAELDEAMKWIWYRQVADSVIASPYLFPRGTQQCSITNIHSGTEENLRLNAKLDAFENAQLLYKKAKKGERGHAVTEKKVAMTTAIIRDLESILANLENIDMTGETGPQKLTGLYEQARKHGIAMPGESGAGLKKETAKATVPYRHFVIDAIDIYAGKTDTQNDELTTRFARPWDIWMHVAQHAGSHVVVRREKNNPWPSKEILVKAASIAAWFSKARHATSAEVHVTEKRFVRKPHGAPGGTVIAERCKTIRVAPRSPREILPKNDFLADTGDSEAGWG